MRGKWGETVPTGLGFSINKAIMAVRITIRKLDMGSTGLGYREIGLLL
jgi:hypothetical protein